MSTFGDSCSFEESGTASDTGFSYSRVLGEGLKSEVMEQVILDICKKQLWSSRK